MRGILPGDDHRDARLCSNPAQTRVTPDSERRIDDIFAPTDGDRVPIPDRARPPAVAREIFPGYIDEPRSISRHLYCHPPAVTVPLSSFACFPFAVLATFATCSTIPPTWDGAANMAVPLGVAAVRSRGTALDGRPFVVRDHVEGVLLDVYVRGEAFGMGSPLPYLQL